MRGVGVLTRLAALLGFSAASSSPSRVAWPELPTTGFIAGRLATIDDAKRGDAVFSTNGTGGSTVRVTIPQYALWMDEHGTKHRVILVQAEHAPDGTEIVGLRGLDGSERVATMPEVILLGTKKPH